MKTHSISFTFKRAIAVLAAALTLFGGHQRLDADIIVINDRMDSPGGNYFGFFAFPPNPDDISSLQGYSEQPSGGNPGSWLAMPHNFDVNRDGNGAPLNGDGSVYLLAGLVNSAITYNPLASGALVNISFSLDINFTDFADPVQFEEFFFYVEDGNSGFLANTANSSISPTNGFWETVSIAGLTSADLVGIDLSGAEGPLSFGFGFISSGDVTAGPVLLSMGVDNFVVSVNSVPEPGMAGIMGLVFAALLLVRRSRWAFANSVWTYSKSGWQLVPVLQ